MIIPIQLRRQKFRVREMQTPENFIYLIISLFFICALLQEFWNYLLCETKLKSFILDLPNKRSSHLIPTVRGGGAIFFLFASLSFLILSSQKLLPWYLTTIFTISSLFISFIGFVDDLKGLTAKKRFFCQMFCIVLNSLFFYLYFSNTLAELLILSILVFWFIFSLSLINFYNFADGINGYISLQFIASSISIIIYTYLSIINTSNFVIIFSLIIIPFLGGLILFLRRNVFKKTIFLGDTGSTFLGFFLAIIFLLCSYYLFKDEKQTNYLSPLYILLTWIFFSHIIFLDCATMIIAKLIAKVPLHIPHKLHIYQIVSRKKGFTHLKTTALFFVIQIVLNILFTYLKKHISTFDFFGFIFLYLLLLTIFLIKYHLKSLNFKTEYIS